MEALKIGQVLNCKCLDFRAEVFKLGGVKALQGGREHSSDVTIECIFLYLFFCQTLKLVFPKQLHPSH